MSTPSNFQYVHTETGRGLCFYDLYWKGNKISCLAIPIEDKALFEEETGMFKAEIRPTTGHVVQTAGDPDAAPVLTFAEQIDAALMAAPYEIAANDPAVLDWDMAVEKLNRHIKQYKSLEGTPGVNVEFALNMVLGPLAQRVEEGERCQELFDEIMAIAD